MMVEIIFLGANIHLNLAPGSFPTTLDLESQIPDGDDIAAGRGHPQLNALLSGIFSRGRLEGLRGLKARVKPLSANSTSQ
ncbi:hypothetical protein, partial [Pseudomonas sp. PI1]|uniref:hypothetical protein n=1 Tax=Pseudomonas sp. PI1 TaxID=1582493 RepID=UPI001F42B037